MSVNKDEPNHLMEISEKLDAILGFLAVRGMEGDTKAMFDRLRVLGLDGKAIARVTGLTENAVAIRFTRLKKKGSRVAPG